MSNRVLALVFLLAPATATGSSVCIELPAGAVAEADLHWAEDAAACPQPFSGERRPTVSEARVCAMERRCQNAQGGARWFGVVRLRGDPYAYYVPAAALRGYAPPVRLPPTPPEAADVRCLEASVASEGALAFVTPDPSDANGHIEGVERLEPGTPLLACGGTGAVVAVHAPGGARLISRDQLVLGCRHRAAGVGPSPSNPCRAFVYEARARRRTPLLVAAPTGGRVDVAAWLDAGATIEVRRFARVLNGSPWFWVEDGVLRGWVAADAVTFSSGPLSQPIAREGQTCPATLQRLRITCRLRRSGLDSALARHLRRGADVLGEPYSGGWRLHLLGVTATVASKRCLVPTGVEEEARFRLPAAAADGSDACRPPALAGWSEPAPFERSETLEAHQLRAIAGAAARGVSSGPLRARAARLAERLVLTGRDLDVLVGLGVTSGTLASLLGHGAPASDTRESAWLLSDAEPGTSQGEPCDWCAANERLLGRWRGITGLPRAADAFEDLPLDQVLALLAEELHARPGPLGPADRWLLAAILRQAGGAHTSTVLLEDLLRDAQLTDRETALLGSLRLSLMESGAFEAGGWLLRRCEVEAGGTGRDLACFLAGGAAWGGGQHALAVAAFQRVGGHCPTVAARAAHGAIMAGMAKRHQTGTLSEPWLSVQLDRLLSPPDIVRAGLDADPTLRAAWTQQAGRLATLLGDPALGLRLLSHQRDPWDRVVAAAALGPDRALRARAVAGAMAAAPDDLESQLWLVQLALAGCRLEEAGRQLDQVRRELTLLEGTQRVVGGSSSYAELAGAACEGDLGVPVRRMLSATGAETCRRFEAIGLERERLRRRYPAIRTALPPQTRRAMERWHGALEAACDEAVRTDLAALEGRLGSLVRGAREATIDLANARIAAQATLLMDASAPIMREVTTPRLPLLLGALEPLPARRRGELVARLGTLPMRFSPPSERDVRRAMALGLDEDELAAVIGDAATLRCGSPTGSDWTPTGTAFHEAVYASSPQLIACLERLAEAGISEELFGLFVASTPAYALMPATLLEALPAAKIPERWVDRLRAIQRIDERAGSLCRRAAGEELR